ncbi:hypothetical protein ASC78_07385 [Variovorax sp. Root318D1]|uniref:hypothetical protein n=1 Tax=Variovorax sp. Root318D1 TaxID=1736513 RepID=UPI0006F32BAC|nr:hypothetical protein [Variovorax sp. Root318D1]KQU85179.1 hypothetical protein ASC78_07385 [Variovorax sp. Root318D1]
MNDVERNSLTPKERLAISRRALVRELNGDDERDDRPRVRRAAAEQEPDGTPGFDDSEAQGHSFGQSRRWVSMARSMTERWWRRHPAHAMGQLARPLLEHYARKEPAKLMAIAAGTGAALVLLKPWRLLSFTAVLAAVLKTSDVADVVNTLMQKHTSPRKDPS